MTDRPTTDRPAVGLEIRRARPGEDAALLDLLTTSMGQDDAVAWSLDFWRWKHEANPFGRSPVLVAEMDGRLVGLRAFMHWRWQAGTRSVAAVRAVDTATHPDARGQGVFRRLTLRLRDEMERDGEGFVFNTPNAMSRPGYAKMGWSLVGRPTVWMRPVRPVRLARALAGDGLGGDEEAPPAVDAEPAVAALGRPEVESVVLAAAGTDARYHTVPTLEYLRWRYADVPSLSYAAVASGEGEHGAVAFVRTRQRGPFRELRVCDLVVGPRGASAARRLLRRVSRLGDVDAVVAMGAPGLTAATLVRVGYLPVPRSGPLLAAYPLAVPPGSPDPSRLASWAPSIGALELF